MNSSKLAQLEAAIAVIDDRAANTEMLLEPYRNERDELAQRLANATLQDDALQLAAAQIRKQLLDTEIARLEGDGRRDAFQRSELASLLADEENKLKEKLLTFMESQKPFLNPDLTLRQLAVLMHSNTSVLSGVIDKADRW